jgi:hypothetical protein
MTDAERLDRIEAIAANTAANLDKLTQVTATVTAHDEQIENILTAVERMDADRARTDASIHAMADETINTQREWQAYLRRLPRQ